MIARKMPNKDHSKSKVNHATDIYNYINNLISNKPEEKVLFNGTLNIDAKEHEDIIVEMVELGEKSRSKNPYIHIVVSFHDDENIDEETAKKVVEQIIKDLGYEGCQTAYTGHLNTGHKHIHICINRVDKDKLICRDDYNDVHKLHKSLAICSKKYGFKTEEHDRYIVDDNGDIHRALYVDDVNTVKISNEAHAKEIHSGEKSMQRIAAEELPNILKSSQSWFELHERLANVGFKYIKKGGGATLIGQENGKNIEIKPSSLFKQASLKYMQDRLGKYIEPTNNNSQPIDRKSVPMEGVDENLLNEHKNIIENIEIEEDKIYKEFEETKENIKKDMNLMVDFAKKELPENSIEYQAMVGAIKAHTEDQVKYIVDKYKEKIRNHKNITAHAKNFDTWLQINKPEEYIKYKETIDRIGRRIELPESVDHTINNKISLFEQYHNAVKAERYRVTCIKGAIYDDNGNMIQDKKSLVLDKTSRDSPSFGWTPEKIIENMSKMTYFENKGEHIYLTPLSDNKHHFFVDDVDPNSLDRLIHDGLNPSCILQSSPNNFQCIYTLPKLGTENDEDIINDLAQGMNIRYGDINFCGAEHAHRAPGFFNTKRKYLEKYGKMPIVQLIDASGEECELLKKYMIYMDNYYDYLNKKIKENKIIRNISECSSLSISNNELYNVHQKDIVRINKLASIDYSRMDFMIAVRLRATGHTYSEIENIIRTCTPERGKHNIENYARLTVEAAFSNKGDYVLDKYMKFSSIWRKLENSANDKSWYFYNNKNIKNQQQKEEIKEKQDTEIKQTHHFSR